MLFALICTDKPESFALRAATRPAHLAYLDGRVAALRSAGGMQDEQGRVCGSLLIIEAADAEAAADFARQDPYAQAGLFASVVIRPFREVFHDGQRVA